MTVVKARRNLFGSKSCFVRRIEGKSVTLLEIYFQRYKSRKDLVIHPRADFGNKTSPNWKCSFRFNWGMFCVIKAWNKSSRYLMRFFSGLENLQIFCQRLEQQSIRLLTNDTLLAFFQCISYGKWSLWFISSRRCCLFRWFWSNQQSLTLSGQVFVCFRDLKDTLVMLQAQGSSYA